MATAFIPAQLRRLTGGIESIEIDAATVAEVLRELDRRFPGMKQRLCDGDDLKASITVAVNGNVSPRGRLQKLQPDSEVHFLPVIGGG